MWVANMSNDREWDNFVSYWNMKNSDKGTANNYTGQKNHGTKDTRKPCNDTKNEGGGEYFNMQSCIESFCKSFGISVPVTVTPFAVPGKPTAKSAGEYEVNPCCKCCDNENNNLKFTITQKMNVDIPVLFGAEICFDKASAVDSDECTDEDNGCNG